MSMERFWEIDFVRGIAIILMLVSNVLTDLEYFHLYILSFNWVIFPRFVLSMFVFIAGLSLYISYSRRKEKTHFMLRGIRIFIYGLLTTMVTFFLIPSKFIFFGVLHFLGISIMFGYFLIPHKALSIFLLFLSLTLYPVFYNIQDLFLFGIVPMNINTLDYVSFIPWFSVFLSGVLFSQRFYKNGNRKFLIRCPKNFEKWVCVVGRNSLKIYLIHQPIVVTVLSLLFLCEVSIQIAIFKNFCS